MKCYGFNCTAEATVRLKAWGPGKVRAFCEDCAEVRRNLSGYTSRGVKPVGAKE